MSLLDKARANNKLRANFSPLVENTIEIKTDKKASKSFINKLNTTDLKIKEFENKIESILYSDSMTFSKLAKVGFYTLMVYSLIESIEPNYKDNKKLLNNLRKVKGHFKNDR